MDKLYDIFKDLVWLTQLGLSMLLPPVMCLCGCWWLVNNLGWPSWIFLPALVVGLAAGAKNFWDFAKRKLRQTSREGKSRIGFNRHV